MLTGLKTREAYGLQPSNSRWRTPLSVRYPASGRQPVIARGFPTPCGQTGLFGRADWFILTEDSAGREGTLMFDYFGVLVSVIFGLALTHILRGLAKTLQLRRQCRTYVPHLIWSLNVILFVLESWWGMFWWRNLADWTFDWFLFISFYAIVQFVWSYMLYPPEISEGTDHDRFFFDNRQWFFGLAILVLLMDIPEVLVKAKLGLRPMPSQYPIVSSALIVIGVVGFFSKNRRVHAVLPVAWLVVFYGYALISAIHRIASTVP
jgi:hypothetical protein